MITTLNERLLRYIPCNFHDRKGLSYQPEKDLKLVFPSRQCIFQQINAFKDTLNFLQLHWPGIK